ncbi:MAG: hypothetical protein COV52_00865 [Gammaproteobacteria bacterium CG11_big_fil_rev_8_21_14_0_20_46_22]|nr:MAG: hypothetical protein COV52_00865 [Gammaproteobacteria bacterium CG11_big_fil_rev_8_21_14_0_20_46_22]
MKITEPRFAILFFSQRSNDQQDEAYYQDAQLMLERVAEQKGFLRHESVRNQSGYGLTISYWGNLEAIKQWRSNPEHKVIQAKGRSHYYQDYTVRCVELLSMGDIFQGSKKVFNNLSKPNRLQIVVSYSGGNCTSFENYVKAFLAEADSINMKSIVDYGMEKSIVVIELDNQSESPTLFQLSKNLLNQFDCQFWYGLLQRSYSFNNKPRE